jgi:ABC-type dipeptide/oligopeptide/nickel transport system permease subunit
MRKFTQRFFKIAGKDNTSVISGLILIFWIIIALIPLIFPLLSHIPIHLQQRLHNPSWQDWFGVDGNGQSVGLLIMNGASTSLIVSLFTVGMSLLVGIPLGAIAGFFGGKIDIIISR